MVVNCLRISNGSCYRRLVICILSRHAYIVCPEGVEFTVILLIQVHPTVGLSRGCSVYCYITNTSTPNGWFVQRVFSLLL